MHREKMLEENSFLQAWQLLHSFLAEATIHTTALSLSTPFLQLLSLTITSIKQALQQGLWQTYDILGWLHSTALLIHFPAAFCLLAFFSGPPLGKGKEKNEKI